jgi:hypothetical protein
MVGRRQDRAVAQDLSQPLEGLVTKALEGCIRPGFAAKHRESLPKP